jgi:hypothetical protein
VTTQFVVCADLCELVSQLVPDRTLFIAHLNNQEDAMFAPARQLDPLRVVQGENHRYDCPDVATLDRHLTRLRHRLAAAGNRSPTVAAACRADIDQLLDRRVWLTLPHAPEHFELPTAS